MSKRPRNARSIPACGVRPWRDAQSSRQIYRTRAECLSQPARRGEYFDISHQIKLPNWSDHAGSGHGPSVRTQTATEPDFAFGSASPTQTPPVTRFTPSPYSFRSMEVITRTEDRSPGF